MNFNKFITMLILSIMIFNSCHEPTEIDNNLQYNLLFNLTANEMQQIIHIYKNKFFAESDSGIDFSEYFVNDAKIELISINQIYSNFAITEDYSYSSIPIFDKGYYYTNIDSLPIKPENEYSIRVVADDDTIVGNTILPSDFSILTPIKDNEIKRIDLYLSGYLDITWTKSAMAAGYLVKIETISEFTYNDSLYVFKDQVNTITQDTTFRYFSEEFREGEINLKILAYDINFHKFIVDDPAIGNLSNATGFFGSSVLKELTIKVK